MGTRYEMDDHGNALRHHNDTNTHRFGERRRVRRPAAADVECQHRVIISGDKSTVWLDSRTDDTIQLTRAEAVELVSILNRELILDQLADI